MNEMEWRSVRGYEGLYEVSSCGDVRAVPRKGTRGDALSAWIHRSGHLMVHLYRDGIGSHRGIHQLVAEAFIGPGLPDQEVRHLDGIPANNRPGNLAWGTRGENNLDAVEHGTHGMARKTHCPQGHPYEGSNLHITPSGSRICRQCRREHGRAKMRRSRARLRAAGGELGAHSPPNAPWSPPGHAG